MEKKNETSLEYEKVINHTYELIRQGELSMGDKLPTERELAAKLGIGRNSTREAMSILHGMGLVERRQGSGNYLNGDPGEAIHKILTFMLALGSVKKKDICDFRRLMEKNVCDILLQTELTVEQKTGLQELLHQMEISAPEHLAEVDKAFHDRLVFLTGNRFLQIFTEAVSGVYREWIERVHQRASLSEQSRTIAFHKDIYEKLVRKDEVGLMAVIDAHYDFIEEKLL